MRISLIHPTMYGLGGAERVVFTFAQKLMEKGHSIEILSIRFDDFWKKKTQDACMVTKEVGYDFGQAGYFLSLGLLAKKLSKLVDRNVDVLCPCNFPSALVVKEFKRNIANAPAVWYCEEPYPFFYDKEYLRNIFPHYRLVFTASRLLHAKQDKDAVKNSIDLILANSKFTSRRVQEIYHVSSEVVYLGTDPERFRPGLKVPEQVRKVREGVDWFLFAPLGRLSFSKNVVRLVFVGDRLVRSGYRVRILITGEGYLQNTLKGLAERLGISEEVVLGVVSENDLPYYYSLADAVVYPSLNEPFGLAVVESMASGVPAVVANTGGPSETVIDEVTGIHVNPYSIDSIVRGITKILEDDDLRRKMGRQGRKHVLNNYTWDRTISEYERHLSAAIGGNNLK